MNPISLFVRARLTLHMTSVTGFVVAGGLLGSDLALAATLPVPCAPGACIANKTPGFTAAPPGFVTSGKASATSQGNTLTVTQASPNAILNWQSFNISADGKVIFQQPSVTSIALNKIYQASPSSIFGALTANGQIYLINPNGFVFGPSSTVNVAGLMASSLGLKQGDAELAAGIIPPVTSANPAPSLESDGRTYVVDSQGNFLLDASGNKQPVQIVVQPGAQITATDNQGQGGRLLLVAQNVTNAGTLSAPDGQIILAAAGADPSGAGTPADVFLQTASSAEPWLRGLIVQVTQAGLAQNLASGVLSAPRGNISLIGLAVNQSGRISATTAVSANGSVTLQATTTTTTGGAGSCSPPGVICSTQGGTLTLGPTSEIDVLPELESTATAPLAQAQIQSTLQLSGKQIDIAGQINAPAGSLNVLAADNPSATTAAYNPDAEIRVASGTSINLAGSDAELPMSANLVSVQLLANELADDPDQHNGALHGETVIVDVRNGRPPIISDTSWQSVLDSVQESIAQRTSVGGSASFFSQGDVVVSSGATLNVSGGQWTYAPGVTQTSELIGANGHLYSISTADPLLTYTGVLNPTYTQAYPGFGVQITQPTPGLGQYQSGYVQGFSAGTVQFAAPSMAMQGTLLGTAVNGPYQRSSASIPAESFANFYAAMTLCGSATGTCLSSSGLEVPVPSMATGGTLILGDPNAEQRATSNPPILPAFFDPGVTFVSNAAPVVVAPGAPLPVQTLQLPVSYITTGGFSQTEIFSDSTVTLPQGLPLNLGTGASLESLPASFVNTGPSLQITAPRIVVDSNIQAVGGTIALSSIPSNYYSLIPGAARLGIEIGDGVTLDVSGQWTNNSIHAPTSNVAPTYQDGGTIDLSLVSYPPTTASQIVLGNGVSLEANGGAWLQASNAVVGGVGGSITIAALPQQSALQIGQNVTLDAFGVQGAAGGHFVLAAPQIEVSQGNGTWAAAQRVDDFTTPGATLDIGAALFSQYGFSSVSLTATGSPSASSASNDVLTVSAGTTINPQAQTWVLTAGYPFRASGGTLQGFTQLELPPPVYQHPQTVTLQALPPAGLPGGDLDIQAGSAIVLPPSSGGQINLNGQGSILVDGLLRAPGGGISMDIEVPTVNSDPGFFPNQRLELGAQAVLDVSGTLVVTPNSQNLPLGTVLAGGTISLIADRGDVIADPGSRIDIAGASAPLSVQLIGGSSGYASETVGSPGGSLTVESSESISLVGSISAAAGANSTGTLAAGSLVVGVEPLLFDFHSPFATNAVPPPSATPTIELVSSTAGSAPSASYGEIAVLGIAQLQQWGIDSLTLHGGLIALDSNVALSLDRQITLDAQTISVSYGTNASLSAPYVALIDAQEAPNSAGPGTAVGGTGSLTASAQQIVLGGYTALQGVGKVTLNSTGDVELEPMPGPVNGELLTGQLSMAGSLTINASRLYPSTATAYTFSDPGGSVTLAAPGASGPPQVPLSVGGSLSIDAADITSSGRILAPFGEIALNASGTLTLAAGSVTSVSGDGATLPYGQTTLGQQAWIYLPGNVINSITAVPARQVSLNAPSINFASGATIDVSGGGDLSAYEWVPGTGGYTDALSQQAAATSHLYAIIPTLGASYAAYDAQEFTGSNVSAGATVYLTAGSGLPAGYYTLLPARYALLPGAYLVQLESNYTSLLPGVIGGLNDGTPVVAGYLSVGTTGIKTSPGYVGFAVRPPTYTPSLAEYAITDASSFFNQSAATTTSTASSKPTPPPVLPADAGTLLIEASAAGAGSSITPAMNLQGNVMAAAGKGGTAATIEISAPTLTVTATGGEGLTLSAPTLQSWNGGDLILGGALQPDGSIGVTASSVSIDSGTVAAGQVFVVADQSITVGAGATVASNSGLMNAPPVQVASTPLNLVSLRTTGGKTQEVPDPTAGLLAVSDTTLPLPGTSTTSSGASISMGGTLSTRGAVALETPGSITVGGQINAPGASWALSTGSIAFVGASGVPAGQSPGLSIGTGLLSQIREAGSLWLGASDISFWTPLTLGASGSSPASTPTLNSLTLSAATLNSSCATSCSPVTLGGQTVTLNGTNPTVPTAGTLTPGGGSLTLVAGTLDVTGTNLTVYGTQQTRIVSGTAVATQANGAAATQDTGTLSIAGDLDIRAPVITASSGSATTLAPAGNLTIEQNGAAPKPESLTASLGGHLAFTAASITDSGSIIVPGGTISLAANTSTSLSSSAMVSTRGIVVSVGDQIEGAAGGNVSITAGTDLTLAQGSMIDVSAPAVPGLAAASSPPAGSLSLSAGGTATLNGTLSGQANGGGTGGSFSLSAGQLSGGLTQLAGTLGGFGNQIGIEVGSGDLDLASGAALTANKITLTADSGTIDIAGVLSAPSAGLRGSIGLFAGSNVVLEQGAQLLANGTASNAAGGQIELSSTNGMVFLNGGTVSAAGTAGGPMGSLLLRAPAVQASGAYTGDVAIGNIGADVSAVGQLIIEPVLTLALPAGSTLDQASFSQQVLPLVSSYLSQGASVIPGRFGTNALLEPGVEIDASGNLTVSGTQPLDLYAMQTSGQLGAPIDLTVRAAGDLMIAGTVSDGVSGENGTLGAPIVLSGTPSSSLRFVAGANLVSANPLAVLLASTNTSTLTIGTGALVRTGTGDIDLVAAGDVIFNPGSSAYTTGEQSASMPAQPITFDRRIPPVALNFPTQGGNIVVAAGLDVQGQNAQSGAKPTSVADWQLRFVQAGTSQAEWGLDLAEFDLKPFDLATFGGGDLSIAAGHDVLNASAAAADSMWVSPSSAGTQAHIASGGLTVVAGHNITAGQFSLANGSGSLTAGGSFATAVPANPGPAAQAPVGSIFELESASLSLWAQGDITVEGVFNPTAVYEPVIALDTNPIAAVKQQGFYTYGPLSSFSAQSAGGDITVNTDFARMSELLGAFYTGSNSNNTPSTVGLNIYPGTLSLAALGQDISLATVVLYPSPSGQLQLFAGRDITGAVDMSDVTANVPTQSSPSPGGTPGMNLVSFVDPTTHPAGVFSSTLHAGDQTPASIVAGGNIDGLTIQIPKPSHIEAGLDITNLLYYGENLSAQDLTLISAGGNITLATPSLANPVELNTVQLSGPGRLDMLAGGSINLGVTSGVLTLGNLQNGSLAPGGADVTMMAGLGQSPDFTGFYQSIIQPSASYQQQLVSYVQSLTGQSGLSVTQAESEFTGFIPDEQRPFIDSVFFNELNLSGIEANTVAGAGYSRGYAAIDALFPGSHDHTASQPNPYSGNLNLTYSEIYTEQGGNISLLVPGGEIDVGLAQAPSDIPVKAPSSLGIVAEGTGNIDIYSTGDVNVNSSRIFTLGGGNILIWSDQGSIDAGRGAKVSLSIPPPTVTYSSSGVAQVNLSAAVSGSGIRTIQADPGVAAGNVNLVAPVGTVNAGEAGIGAAGNINIAALVVTNVANINYGGTATGVPALVNNVTAQVQGAAQTGTTAQTSETESLLNQNKEPAPLAGAAISWLEVFVSGLGEENCKPEDTECLQRQKRE